MKSYQIKKNQIIYINNFISNFYLVFNYKLNIYFLIIKKHINIILI